MMIGNAFSRLSKEVGWEGQLITTYPTKREIRKMNHMQLLQTHRYLRSPETEAEAEVMDYLETRYMDMRVQLEKEAA